MPPDSVLQSQHSAVEDPVSLFSAVPFSAHIPAAAVPAFADPPALAPAFPPPESCSVPPPAKIFLQPAVPALPAALPFVHAHDPAAAVPG